MCDYLTREFRTQLTSTMDSILRKAVFEIMKIFENSLHEHQVELVQKGEEIVQLKIKLQRAEVKLRDSECGGGRGAEVNNVQMNETHREPEDVVSASEQTCDVPEIDFEVPDDWCAPLGCETAKKQDEDTCPSVRLRSLYIPLWPVPVVKQEAANRKIDSRQRTKGRRRSKRASSLNEEHKRTRGGSAPVSGQGTRRPPVRNDMKKLLQDIKQEYTDLTGGAELRRRGRNLTGKEQENTLKRKREERIIAATESESTEQETAQNDGERMYTCKFCKKVFDTQFGRSVHVRSHKRCRGCKKDFPFPSALRSHKPFCLKLKKLLAKETQSADPPKPPSCDEEKPTTPSKKQVVAEKESTPSSSNNSESSAQKDESTKKHICAQCNKKFESRCRLQEHVRVHTGEKPFPCSFCPKKFRIRQSRKHHIMRMHLEEVNSSLANRDLAWTKPLEVTEDNNREDLISANKDASRAVARNNVQRECNPGVRPSERWQTMGTQCSDGFSCSLCQKVVKNKYLLIEHFRTHTGEKPLKCQRCPAKFRSRGQLSIHKRRGCTPVIQCEKCEKIFHAQARYNKHMLKHHKEWPNFCKVCGKGFVTEGRLRNHTERCHK